MLRTNHDRMLSILAAPLLILALLPAVEARASTHGATRIDGDIAGMAWSLMRPQNWNGDLVLLVHGSIPNDFEALAPGFTAQGFGVAFVTLTPVLGAGDGDALRAVTTGTRQVQAQFTSHFGQPDRTYLLGFSRGGENMTRLVETSPARYAGVLSICGANGGRQRQHDYFVTARILFDYYYPGVLPGSPLAMPDLDISAFLLSVAPLVINAVLQDPLAAIEMASVDQYALDYADFGELVSGIMQSLIVHSVTTNSTLAAMHGNPFDNSAIEYTGTSDDDALNAGIARLAADPQARNYVAAWSDPNGSINGTPVMLLHTSRDPIVPAARNNDLYESLVNASGNGEFLLRRTVDRFGHCTVTPAEIFGSFADLVIWAETGSRPAQ